MEVRAPMQHQVITYNHLKCLYCTNCITMLSEWLCGTGIAAVVNEPSRSMINQAHDQAQIIMQQDREPANTLYDSHIHTTLHQPIIKTHCIMYSSCLMVMLIAEAKGGECSTFIKWINTFSLTNFNHKTVFPITPVTYLKLIQLFDSCFLLNWVRCFDKMGQIIIMLNLIIIIFL